MTGVHVPWRVGLCKARARALALSPSLGYAGRQRVPETRWSATDAQLVAIASHCHGHTAATRVILSSSARSATARMLLAYATHRGSLASERWREHADDG